jgi:hypothetical protein
VTEFDETEARRLWDDVRRCFPGHYLAPRHGRVLDALVGGGVNHETLLSGSGTAHGRRSRRTRSSATWRDWEEWTSDARAAHASPPLGPKRRSCPRLTEGPGAPPEWSATGRSVGALARHLLARDERWQKTYYGGDRSNVLRYTSDGLLNLIRVAAPVGYEIVVFAKNSYEDDDCLRSLNVPEVR